MSDEVETMFSARVVPWHGKGEVTPEQLEKVGALKASGLDWTVEKYPIYALVDGKYHLAEDKAGVVRSTDHRVLGVVGDGYQPIQNGSMFEFVDALLDLPDVRFDTGGSLQKGGTVWCSVELNGGVTIGGDKHDRYLLVVNSHNGTRSFRAIGTHVRVVCANTLRLAVQGARQVWSIRHTTNALSRVAEARRTLDLAYEYDQAFQAEVAKLMNEPYSEKQMVSLVTRLFPLPKDKTAEDGGRAVKSAERRRATVLSLYHGDTVAAVKGTKWGALAAVSEWEQWSARSINPKAIDKKATTIANRQLVRFLTGQQPITDKALALLQK